MWLLHCLQSGVHDVGGACWCWSGNNSGAESVGSAGNGTNHSDPHTRPITSVGSSGARGPTGRKADHLDSTSSEIDTDSNLGFEIELTPGDDLARGACEIGFS